MTEPEAKPQRLVFGETLVELGAADERIVVLDADVSSSTQTEHFAAAFPERFFNCGVAEANMISIAAGLATCGYIPFASTFALFISMRAGDPVRALIAQPKLNVKLIGGYAGLSDFADGASHQSVEDLAVMRAVPNMTVVCPSDIITTKKAVRAIAEMDGPVFLRIAREAVTSDYAAEQPFEIGKGIVVRDGADVTLIGCGMTVKMCRAAAEALAAEGVWARVIDLHTLKPIDADLLEQSARQTGAMVTAEEHNVYGGLGGAVCEAICARFPVPVLRCGIPDRFCESGAYAEILERAGITAGNIAGLARKAVAMKNP